MPKYKGSFIAKQIEDDIGRYERDKARALKIKALRDAYYERKRGESNGERTEFSADGLENTTREAGDIKERAKGQHRSKKSKKDNEGNIAYDVIGR